MKRVPETVRRACLAVLACVSVLTGCGGGGGGGGGAPVGDGSPVVPVDPGVDTTAPAVVSTSPAAGATSVPLDVAVTVSFSERVDCATVTASSFTVAAGGSAIAGAVACSESSATFTPSASLAPGTTHTASVTATVKDAAGNALAARTSWSFTTGAAPDTTPPAVVSTSPASGATSVPLNAAVTVSFSEGVDCATVTASSFTVAAGGSAIAGSVACSGSSATFTPSASLAPGTTHTVSVTAAVKDAAGNALAAASTWSFTTGAAPDTTPPAVVSTSPASGATSVPLNVAVTVSFSERVDCAAVTASSFTVAAGGSAIAGSVACSGSSATFTPSASLAPGTTHTATVTTAVKDTAGNALAAPTSWSFTTGAAPDTTPPAVVSIAPPAGATNVALGSVVTVSFSEEVDCATVTASSFLLATGGGRVPGAVACSGSTATFTPSAPLAAEVRHTATVSAADLAGNPMGSLGWSFTTGAAPDTTPPAVVSTSPVSDAVAVLTTTAVSVTFGERIDCASLTTVTFTLETATHAPVAGAVTCDGTGGTFRPSAPLASATEYVATVAADVRDAAGNALGTAHGWRFTTRARAWGPATRLDSGVGEVDAFKLAVNASGAAVAVWVQTDAANQKHLWWAGYAPATGWGAPEPAESLAGDASQPAVIIDANGDTVVAWTHTDATGTAVWTRVRAADGTWGGAWKLWGDAPALGVDQRGNVTCVWRHNDGTRTNVWASRYPLGSAVLGGAWEAAVLIEADDARSATSGPSVAVSKDGDAIAAWTFYIPAAGQYVVTANRYAVASGVWGSAVDVTASSSTSPRDPAVVMNDAGEGLAVWRQEYLNGGLGYITIISTARSTSAGWGAVQQFDWVFGLLAAPPSVAGNGRGDVAVGWAVATCGPVEYRRYVPGTGWGGQSSLSASSCADRPAAALDPDGNIMVAWGERTSATTSLLEASRYTAASASWGSAPATVGTDSEAMLPALAADASGAVVALWLQWDGTRHNLRASRFE